MFFRRCQDEDNIRRRLLQCLQESIEGSCGEHVYLVDDEHLVAAHLRWYARLVHERLDAFHGVVGSGVQLEDVQRPLLVERLAALTMVAGFALFRRRFAVDGLGKDAGAGGLSHAAGTAEQVGVGQLAAAHGVLQRSGQCFLSHYGIERHWTVFPCRYNILHILSVSFSVFTCSPCKGSEIMGADKTNPVVFSVVAFLF